MYNKTITMSLAILGLAGTLNVLATTQNEVATAAPPAAVNKKMVQWVPAGMKICRDVCGDAQAVAVTTAPGMYVCRDNEHGTVRAGYNTPDQGKGKSCRAGHGGEEKSTSKYDCLCAKGYCIPTRN